MTELKKYFTHASKGGYSTCIHDSDLKVREWWSGCTLPNCTALCWGLFNLDHNISGKFDRLQGNAGTLYAKAKATGSGYIVGQSPKDASIAVYGAGTSAGHVVYIVHVFSETSCIGIESNYSGTISSGLSIRVKKGNPKTWYKDYKGCIYDFYPSRKGV